MFTTRAASEPRELRLALEGVDPGAPSKPSSGKFSSASVQATVDLSKLNHSVPMWGEAVLFQLFDSRRQHGVLGHCARNTLTALPDGQLLAVYRQPETNYEL